MNEDEREPTLHAVDAVIIRFEGEDLVTIFRGNGEDIGSGGCSINGKRLGHREMIALVCGLMGRLMNLGKVPGDQSVDVALHSLEMQARNPAPF